MKYAFIAQQRDHYPVSLMCRVLDVSCAGFYAAQKRPPSQRAQQDTQLRSEIVQIFDDSQQRYGSPRIHAERRACGQRPSKKRVARLMRVSGT